MICKIELGFSFANIVGNPLVIKNLKYLIRLHTCWGDNYRVVRGGSWYDLPAVA
jgi:hypothetical protein